MQQHITILGWLYIIFGALGAMLGVLILLGAGIAGVVAGVEGEAGAGLLAGGLGFVLAVVFWCCRFRISSPGGGCSRGKAGRACWQ